MQFSNLRGNVPPQSSTQNAIIPLSNLAMKEHAISVSTVVEMSLFVDLGRRYLHPSLSEA